MATLTRNKILSLAGATVGSRFSGFAILALPPTSFSPARMHLNPAPSHYFLIEIDDGVPGLQYIYAQGYIREAIPQDAIQDGDDYRLGFVAGPVATLKERLDLMHIPLRVMNRTLDISGSIDVGDLLYFSHVIDPDASTVDADRPTVNTSGFVIDFTPTVVGPIDAPILSSRTLPAYFSGSNGSALDINDYDAQDFSVMGPSMQSVGTSVLRLPGGDETNFWDESGLITNGDDIIPVAGWHTHGGALPIWLYYQTNEQTATRTNFKRLYDASGAGRFVYAINCTTSTPAAEVAKLQDLQVKGFTLEWIELGNELFFGVPYYSGSGNPTDGKYLRGHTTAIAYMEDMRDNFVPALRAAFGNSIKLAVPVIPTDGTSGTKEHTWTPQLIATGLKDLIDGSAVHPYYNIDDIGMQLSDVGDSARAGVLGRAAHAKQKEVLSRKSVSDLGPDFPMIITEFNVLEDQSQTSFVALGQSWLHALIQCQNIQIFMADQRVEMALVHSMLGNAQWSALVGEDGINVDATKRGQQADPFTAGYSTPLTPTLSGFLMGIQERLALHGGGTARLLVDGPGFIAHRITSATHDAITVTNTTNDSQSFTLPSDRPWTYQWWANDPWFSVAEISEVPASINGSAGAGSSVTVQPFSQMVFTGTGTSTGIVDAFAPTMEVVAIRIPASSAPTMEVVEIRIPVDSAPTMEVVEIRIPVDSAPTMEVVEIRIP